MQGRGVRQGALSGVRGVSDPGRDRGLPGGVGVGRRGGPGQPAPEEASTEGPTVTRPQIGVHLGDLQRDLDGAQYGLRVMGLASGRHTDWEGAWLRRFDAARGVAVFTFDPSLAVVWPSDAEVVSWWRDVGRAGLRVFTVTAERIR